MQIEAFLLPIVLLPIVLLPTNLGLFQIGEPAWPEKLEQARFWIEGGDFQRAESYLAKETTDPSARGERLAGSLSLSATLQEKMGNFRAAERLYLRALGVLSRDLKDEQTTASVKNNLGELYRKIGQTSRAEKTLREAMTLADANHPALPVIAANLGIIHFERKEFTKSEEIFRKIIESRDREGSLDSGPGAAAMSNLAAVRYKRGSPSEGLQWAERAVRVWESIAPNSPVLAEGLRNCAVNLIGLQKYHQAGEVLQRGASIAIRRLGETHPLVSEIWRLQAEVLRKTGKGKESRQLIRLANKYEADHQRENALGGQVDLSALR